MTNGNQNQQVAKRGATGPLAEFIEKDGVMKRLHEVLGKRAPQFASSLLSLVNASPQLRNANPQSIVAAAMTAATLDLPIQKDLGFAWIVPYKDAAQFQMGFKGYIQLAFRTGQYQAMNAVCVNAEAVGGFNDVGERVILWELLDETKPAVGYAFAFKMVNGFTKTAYWTREKVEAHAGRFSQAVKSKKEDSPWYTSFDQMALKTVVKNTLSKWGILSAELQRAIVEDQGVRNDFEGEPTYVDNEPEKAVIPVPEPEPTPPATDAGNPSEPTVQELREEAQRMEAAAPKGPIGRVRKALEIVGTPLAEIEDGKVLASFISLLKAEGVR